MREPISKALPRILLILVFLSAAGVAWQGNAQPLLEPCPHAHGWKPDDLAHILEAHRVWMIELGFVKLGPDDPEPTVAPDPATLCRADLRGADLTDAYLVEVDFREADLTGAILTDANMIASDLSDAVLVDANLDGTNLFLANLTGADLSRASAREAHFRNATLTGATWTGADLTDVTGWPE